MARSSREQRGELAGVAIAIFAAAVLCVLVPAYLVAASTPVTSAGIWGWPLGVMVASGAALSWLLGAGRPYLYSVAAWVFVYVFLGITPLLQVRFWTSPGTAPRMAAQALEPALWIVAVGVMAMALGMWAGGRRPHSQGATSGVAPRRVRLLTGITLAFVAYVVSSTGVSPYFESRFALGAARAAVWPSSATLGIITGAALALPLVSFHALVHLRRQRKAVGEKPGLFLTTSFMFVVLVVTVNAISSARITFGTALLSLLVLAGAIATRARTRALIAAILGGMVFVFPMADAYRTGAGSLAAPNLRDLATGGDYDAFAQLTNAVLYVDRAGGPTWGDQALGVLFFWVPRSIWPDKAIDTGVLLGQFRGYGFTNLSAPLWAEAYINFGWLGVPIVLGIFGYLLRRGDRRLARSPEGVPAIAGAILPFYVLIVMRGSLLQAMGGLVALAAAILFVQARDPSRQSQRGQVVDRQLPDVHIPSSSARL